MKVTTALDYSVVLTEIHPPSKAEFNSKRKPFLLTDGQIGYQNAFDAMVDAVYYALEKAGASELDIVMSESGWPTAGGPGALEDNPGTYYGNLSKHVKRNGTPKRPAKPVETHVYK
ncbi:Glucan endo-1,3-beta-D-glucosidase [Heracleum sosnowskyi]|uniref:Glucan endo-1,3-beta-D-glucosidase n=1 Tax=Heracleum sosnowskyi TaxID=360622 RepID=A0AAD8M728_9APIA|nr:Glucan endo-1,3-beta-D-glucosidase [Heracleum sosnowskyi]